MSRRYATLFVLMMLLATPAALHACPVCFDANDETRLAFLTTAIFLTLLPLGIVSGAVLWVRRRVRQLAGEEPPAE